MVIFYFPAVIAELKPDFLEHKTFFFFTMLFRAILIPEGEYKVPERTLKGLKDGFYKSFERCLGEDHDVFNTHCFGAHAERFRARGDATVTSCFPFERVFATFPQLCEKGTTALGKQILKGALKAAKRGKHVCRAGIKIRPKDQDTAQSRDSIFYTYSPQAGYSFFECARVEENGDLVAYRIQIGSYQNPYMLDFSLVGVFANCGLENVSQVIARSDVKGYALICENVIMTVPHGTITEL